MKRIVVLLCLCFLIIGSYAQNNFTVAFYNVENLMDTLDNPNTQDNDFLPKGKYKWTSSRYKKKIAHIAAVISKMGSDDGPDLIGLAEVENREVLEDLVAAKEFKTNHYSIVHYDSPDQRGIDLALLYNTKSFKLISSRVYSASFLQVKSHTRDVLLVKGVIEKDTIIVLVNHWPSRRKGVEQSEPKRIGVSIMVREVVDSIQQKSPNAKIIVMGDFNDEPFDKSISIELNAKPENSLLKKGELYNPFFNMSKQGKGSVNYSSKWNMFDQIILSHGFFTSKIGYTYKEAFVYNPDWMHYKKEPALGPFRTYMGQDYKGGYSDHFPVYVIFKKK
ncbi:MAG TPA: endonuclease/exonuclease/phosphatase family protein [Cytophagaceae bacterium]|jgi:predicted extracellular nuclease|nr:endonuclease/exonuclease/phosphatase family protein [Cytophagaceae bacterium]